MNNYQWLDEYLLSKPGVTKNYKVEWGWFRYYVGDKLFAVTCQPGEDHPLYDNRELVTLKTEPAMAELLRAEHPDIIPGFYMDKRIWNSIYLDGQLDSELLHELCDRAYELAFCRLTKKAQREISNVERE